MCYPRPRGHERTKRRRNPRGLMGPLVWQRAEEHYHPCNVATMPVILPRLIEECRPKAQRRTRHRAPTDIIHLPIQYLVVRAQHERMERDL
jgi:hypothetical protein